MKSQTLDTFILYTSDYLLGPERQNNYPIHHLVEMEEIELLKNFEFKKDRFFRISEINKQNPKGETPLILALKKLLELSENQAIDQEEKKQSDPKEETFKEFVLFFLNFRAREIHSHAVEKVTDVNLQDENGNSALHLCVGIRDPYLVELIINHPCFNKKSLAHEFNNRTPFSTALYYRKLDLELLQGYTDLKKKEEKLPTINEDDFLEKNLTSHIQTEEKIASLLFSKICELYNPQELETFLENIFIEFPYSSLEFIEKMVPPLIIAFAPTESLRNVIKNRLVNMWSWSPHEINDDPEGLVTLLKTHWEKIDVLIRFGFTNGNEHYLPIFDVIEQNNPNLLIHLLKSKDFDINASILAKQKGNFRHEGPLFITLYQNLIDF